MDRRLVDVSQAGNMKAFQALLEDDPRILDFIDESPFTRTPLHLAILAQKPKFAKEIAILYPSFITKIDSFGYNPLHLAAKSGQVEIVKSLLQILGPEKVELMIKGKEDKTTLHFAVISGKIEIVNLLLNSYPNCIFDVTIQNESALHLAVKNKQLGVFVVLIQWLQLQLPLKTSVDDDGKVIINDLLNLKDNDGNNILHLAIITKQHQMVEALLSNWNNSRNRIQVDVNALNAKSLTALDILLQFPELKRDTQTEQILIKSGVAKITTLNKKSNGYEKSH